MKIKSIAVVSLLLGFVGSNQLVAHTDQSDEKQSNASQSKGSQVSLRGECTCLENNAGNIFVWANGWFSVDPTKSFTSMGDCEATLAKCDDILYQQFCKQCNF